MSLMCPMGSCKAKPGMCRCEKFMTVVLLAVAVFFIARHFM